MVIFDFVDVDSVEVVCVQVYDVVDVVLFLVVNLLMLFLLTETHEGLFTLVVFGWRRYKKTFAYRRMPFGLCNAPGMFQRCMMEIFHDMIEKTMEVFMDDVLVFGNSFQSCLSHLERMLKRCEYTNLCLNWEKSQFMVKEGIFLGHKISKQGIEVEKTKVDVITKLPAK
nr:reverse transcriptase domain-containing protein [Tanacetum cinerariifolium]